MSGGKQFAARADGALADGLTVMVRPWGGFAGSRGLINCTTAPESWVGDAVFRAKAGGGNPFIPA